MRWLHNRLPLAPFGKPQAAHFAHLVELLLWQPERVHFTNLERCGGGSARTHARWFARDFPFARLAVAALGAAQPQLVGELLALDASFVPKRGDRTRGLGWFWSGMARAARRAPGSPCWPRWTPRRAVPTPSAPGSPRAPRRPSARPAGRPRAGRRPSMRAWPCCGRRSTPGPGRFSRCAGWPPPAARHQDRHGGSAEAGPAHGGTVAQGQGPATGPHARRPGRKRQFDGCFDRRDPGRMARTTLKKEKVDLYHAPLHSKAWQRWLQGVYILPRGADPQTKEGMLLYSTDLELSPARLLRLYRARFQLGFAFRDAKQHLGLNDGQARSQARLHFHFNTVFAALFRVRLQTRLQTEGPLGPFSLCNPKRHHLEEEIHRRIGAGSAPGRNASNAGAGRGRIPPERLWLRVPPLAAGLAGP